MSAATSSTPASFHRFDIASGRGGVVLFAVLAVVAAACGGSGRPAPSPERTPGAAGSSGAAGASGARGPTAGAAGMGSVGPLNPGMEGTAGAGGTATETDAAPTDGPEADGSTDDAGDAAADTADADPTPPPDMGPPPPTCGDGTVDPGEKCDQGDDNAQNAYGMGKCTDTCSDAPYCGDQRIDTTNGEKCDRGSQNSANAYGPDACTDKCQPAPSCGDGQPNRREECDEGARNSDGPPAYGMRICTKACKVLHPRCGDNTTQAPNEECDDGSRNVAGPYGSRGQCTRACKRVDFCGDGKVTRPQEQCEPPNSAATPGKAGCDARCRTVAPLPQCGNGQKEAGEECDNGSGAMGNLPGTDAYSSSATRRSDGKDVCNSACKVVHFCGDRRHDAVDRANREECDNGTSNSNTGACTLTCKLPKCGDGFKQGSEQCDDGADNGKAGKCKADCSGAAPVEMAVAILPNRIEGGGRTCSGPCLTEVRNPGGSGVPVACVPAAGASLAPGELGSPTLVEFPKGGATLVRAKVVLEPSAGNRIVQCFLNADFLAPVGAGGDLPVGCLRAAGSSVRVQITNANMPGSGMPTSCVTLSHARLDAVATTP